MGLSHSIGHALGATYGIPHGITSCLTLAPTLALKARTKPEEAQQIARVLPVIGEKSTGSVQGDAKLVSKRVAELVEGLGHKSTLTQVDYMLFLAFGNSSWRGSGKLTMRSTKFRLERKRVLLFMRLLVAKNIRISRTVSFATSARVYANTNKQFSRLFTTSTSFPMQAVCSFVSYIEKNSYHFPSWICK